MRRGSGEDRCAGLQKYEALCVNGGAVGLLVAPAHPAFGQIPPVTQIENGGKPWRQAVFRRDTADPCEGVDIVECWALGIHGDRTIWRK